MGIWRRRGTPSFWRSTSQCAFAVLGEIPRRTPTSSFEYPAAISATTWSCRCVRLIGWSLRTGDTQRACHRADGTTIVQKAYLRTVTPARALGGRR